MSNRHNLYFCPPPQNRIMTCRRPPPEQALHSWLRHVMPAATAAADDSDAAEKNCGGCTPTRTALDSDRGQSAGQLAFGR